MKYIKFFDNVSCLEPSLVGSKNAMLARLIQDFKDSNLVKIPYGFAVTVEAYWEVVNHNGLLQTISDMLFDVEKSGYNPLEVARVGAFIRDQIVHAALPIELCREIDGAYTFLCQQQDQQDILCAVRSSATAEDLPHASFAGQQDSFLNVGGTQNIIDAYKKCIASLFTDRALLYRREKGFDHMAAGISVGIQKMVPADEAQAGVIFTLEPETGFKDVIVINAVRGLGEGLVQGAVTPDEYHLFKPLMTGLFSPIVKKDKKYSDKMFVLTDDEIMHLGMIALELESYYNRAYVDQRIPLDIEWARDVVTQDFYIVQVRPETVHSNQKNGCERIVYRVEKGSDQVTLATGHAIGQKAVTGIVRVIPHFSSDIVVEENDIIVTHMTDPDWIPLLKKARGVITENGGRTCHAAIVSRELGIPAIVGVTGALYSLKSGEIVTLDCTQGMIGSIYNGAASITTEVQNVQRQHSIPTSIGLVIADPDKAYLHSQLPVDEVGLVRLEFMIAHMLKAHPMGLLYPEKINDPETRESIKNLITGYVDGADFFVKKLAQGIGTIAAAFYPRSVLVRFSDFKSNEYRNLIGGTFFEAHEENPMLGLRGASRYYHPSYAPAFALECKAIKYVCSVMGFTNVNVMIPFVRTVDEARKVQQKLHEHGLYSLPQRPAVFMMCELPSNVILLEQFAEIFDGFSIGSNDLTQTVLAVDRDSGVLAPLFKEDDEAVLIMIKEAIRKAHKHGKKIGICGQAPSDNRKLAEFLLDCKIDSISLNSDAVIPFIQDKELTVKCTVGGQQTVGV